MFDNITYLDDILGMAIGFTTIMLLLSLAITALVQAIQNFLSLRRHNLACGVESVLKTVFAKEDDPPLEISRSEINDKILRPPLENVGVRHPKITWIENDQLIKGVRRATEALSYQLTPDDEHRIEEEFENIKPYLRKRFSTWVRYISTTCALLVTLILQVDSLDLIRRLSTDPNARLQMETAAAGLVDDLSETVVPDDSLEHDPEIAIRLDRLKEYGDEAALFDIRPLSQGWDYYKNFGHILGMLLTVVFLTFGAPFWFERLRGLINLRELLSIKNDDDKK